MPGYSELESKLMELKPLRIRIGRKTLDGPSRGESFAAHLQCLEELENKKEKLEGYLAHRIPEIRLERKFRVANRKTIAGALAKTDVLVEFIRSDTMEFFAVPARGDSIWKPAHYIAFVLQGGERDKIQMFDLGEAAPIDTVNGEFRQCISVGAYTYRPPKSGEFILGVGKTLGFSLRGF
jgi:hypothetical protein